MSFFFRAAVFAAALFRAVDARCAADSFGVGNYQVRIERSSGMIAPTVTFCGRTFQFAYRTDTHLADRASAVRCRSAAETDTYKTVHGPAGVRVSYFHRLETSSADGGAVEVGRVETVIDFRPGRIDVAVSAAPAAPGRYQLRHHSLFQQVTVFRGFEKCWRGSVLEVLRPDGTGNIAALCAHGEFDPARWGMNGYGYRSVVFGGAPGIITFKAGENSGWSVNRYKGGFEISASHYNQEAARRIQWKNPIRYTYSILMEE
jgi:hypothetical protein